MQDYVMCKFSFWDCLYPEMKSLLGLVCLYDALILRDSVCEVMVWPPKQVKGVFWSQRHGNSFVLKVFVVYMYYTYFPANVIYYGLYSAINLCLIIDVVENNIKIA